MIRLSNNPTPAAPADARLSRRGLMQAGAAALGAVSLPVATIALASYLPGPEPLVGLRKRFVDLMELSRRATDAEAVDAAADAASDLRHESYDLRAATPAGALASLEWAREEFSRHYVDEPSTPDWLDQWTLAMMDSAIGVLRATVASAGVVV